jgi:S1-C subfamily serine protease
MSATHLLAAPAVLAGLLVGAPAIEKAGPGFLGVQVRVGPTGNGIEVVKLIEGCPAEKAGLKAGDLITQLDGEAVGGVQEFVKSISSRKAGDKVKLQISRDGKTDEINVTLGEVPKDLIKDPPKDK